MSYASMCMFDVQLKHMKEGGKEGNEVGEAQVGRSKGPDSRSIPIASSPFHKARL
jgi:hypothetical protein